MFINNYFRLSYILHLVPGNLPAIFRNNPAIVNLVLLEIDENNEMPALLFDWNNPGFNDTAVAGCRGGTAGQTKAAVIANLVANGATNYKNKDILFTSRDGGAIGTWSQNVDTNLAWYELIIYVLDSLASF
jgi:hypothetical protein